MSRPQDHQKKVESGRAWLSGLAIIVTTLVCLFGFWRLAPVTTFVIAAAALAGMIVSFWVAGGED